MDEVTERFRKVAGQFTQRVEGVPDGAWANPSPCAGWDARDVVRHLVEWVPGYLQSNAGVDLPAGPPVDDDPAGAWRALRDGVQTTLDDPVTAGREIEGPGGPMTIGAAIDMIVTGDVLVHTWDLARAAGLDETLDAEEVHRMFAGMEPYDEALRTSGHYGPRVVVPDDADEQTKLLAFMGRRP